jgi:hypothetical protein
MPPARGHAWDMEMLTAALLVIVTMAYLELHQDD